jgi:hypothetical protein
MARRHSGPATRDELAPGMLMRALGVGVEDEGAAAGERADPAPSAARARLAVAAVIAGTVLLAGVLGPGAGAGRYSAESGANVPAAARVNGSVETQGDSFVKTRMFRSDVVLGAAAAAAVSMSALAGDAVQWRVADGGNGHWYSRVEGTESWNWHESNCRALGGHLATVTSSAEQAFVGKLNAVSNTWIGGYQIPNSCEPGCGWAWVTGEMWSYQNWDSWAPDNYYPNDNYLHVDTNDNRWNDQVEDSNYPAILEWSADCNSDGIVDYGQCHDGTLPDYNGNNIPDCCDQGVQCIVGNYPVQWRVEDGGNGHWYRSYPAGTFANWNQADAFARASGAHLATLTSQIETDFVWESLASSPSCWKLDMNFSGPAIGGIEVNGHWTWVTGESWGFANWGPCYQANSEQRLHFGCNSLSNLWNNIHDWEANIGGAILEWSADCNNDNIVDYGQILNGQLADTNTNGIPDCCEPGNNCCVGDIYVNHIIDGGDLGVLLSEWGVVTPTTNSDLNRDGFVNGADLGMLLANWGPCGA